jgi:nicotinamidase-related amidase
LAAWRAVGGLVVHTRESHRPDLSDCPPAKQGRGKPLLRIGDLGPMGRILVTGEPGSQIIPALSPLPGEIVIDKPGKGAFYATDLHAQLQTRGITRLIFGGVTTEVCVQSSMREANDRGYDGLLLEDCTESYFPAFKAATLAMVRAQGGIVGWTANSADLLAALHKV